MTTFKKGGETKEKIPVVVEPASQTDAAMSPKEMKARFRLLRIPHSFKVLPQSRKFSEDTDYYNTSPLKHRLS
ncbi:ADM_collapsed_G0052570.mRNA.1.CDS.1 [Saccharomyces cerevisiae]|nr:ADM_collapsed_G0052570.mRNA.1.CDS.1 [Saccharomyces cerevisiae]